MENAIIKKYIIIFQFYYMIIYINFFTKLGKIIRNF